MPNAQPSKNRTTFLWLLAVLYIAEGFGQVGALFQQPLKLHLIHDLDWNAGQIQTMLNIAMIPWFAKPIFGVLCDFLPIAGSRYKLYLLCANTLAALCFLALMGATSVLEVEIGLTLTAVGMSTVSAVSGAMVVVGGKESGGSGKFVSHQWLWFWVANVAASYIGGELSEWYVHTPVVAMHYAAICVAGVLLPISVAVWFLVEEEPARLDAAGAKEALKGLWAAVKLPTLWVVSAVVFVYYCAPALVGTPSDVYVQKHNFEQIIIGYMNMAGGVGHIIGAIVYAVLQKRVSFKTLVYWSCSIGALSLAAYAFLINPWVAVGVNLVNGFGGMLAVCALLTLAADRCPKGSGGFTYAVLTTIRNGAAPIAGWIGSYLFDNFFGQQLTWVAFIAVGVGMFGVFLLRFLQFDEHKEANG
jgi:MFS family permease